MGFWALGLCIASSVIVGIIGGVESYKTDMKWMFARLGYGKIKAVGTQPASNGPTVKRSADESEALEVAGSCVMGMADCLVC